MKNLLLFFVLSAMLEGTAGGFEYNSKTGVVTDKKKKLFVFKSQKDFENESNFIHGLFSIEGMQVCSIFTRNYTDSLMPESKDIPVLHYFEVFFYDDQTKVTMPFTNDKMKLIQILLDSKMLNGESLDLTAKQAFMRKYDKQ